MNSRLALPALYNGGKAAGSINVIADNGVSGAAADPATYSIGGFGDQ